MSQATQLYKAFPIKDFGLVSWEEVHTYYEPFAEVLDYALLEEVLARGGFEYKEWNALKSGDINRVRVAFNWYANILILPKRGKKMVETNTVKATNLGKTHEDPNLRIVEEIVKFGAGTWELLHKESSKSDGWAETTKALEIMGLGVVVKVTCSCRNAGGVTVLTNTTTFVPGAVVVRSTDNAGVVMGRCLEMVAPTMRYLVDTPETAARVASTTKGKRKGKKVRGANVAIHVAAHTATTESFPEALARAASKSKTKKRGRPKGAKNKPKSIKRPKVAQKKKLKK